MNLKNITLLIVVVFLTSCAQVLFVLPQPQKGIVVKSFLEDVRGVYADTVLEIEIRKNELLLEGDLFKLTTKEPLENEVQVKYYKNFYFANFLDSIYYSVYMAKFYENKLALYMLNADILSIAEIEKIMEVALIDSINENYLIDPSKKQFDKLIDYHHFDVTNVLDKRD